MPRSRSADSSTGLLFSCSLGCNSSEIKRNLEKTMYLASTPPGNPTSEVFIHLQVTSARSQETFHISKVKLFLLNIHSGREGCPISLTFKKNLIGLVQDQLHLSSSKVLSVSKSPSKKSNDDVLSTQWRYRILPRVSLLLSTHRKKLYSTTTVQLVSFSDHLFKPLTQFYFL